MVVKNVTLGVTELKLSALLGYTTACLTPQSLFLHLENGTFEGHRPSRAVVQIQ